MVLACVIPLYTACTSTHSVGIMYILDESYTHFGLSDDCILRETPSNKPALASFNSCFIHGSHKIYDSLAAMYTIHVYMCILHLHRALAFHLQGKKAACEALGCVQIAIQPSQPQH